LKQAASVLYEMYCRQCKLKVSSITAIIGSEELTALSVRYCNSGYVQNSFTQIGT